MTRKLLVISIDSMVEEDLPIISALPNMGKILAHSSVVHKMESNYPTLTHVIHASIITGCYPERHGIICNEQFQPGVLSPPWYEDASCLEVPTLLDVATAKGFRTASVCWPLTLHATLPWVVHRAGIRVPPEQKRQVAAIRSTPGLLAEMDEVLKPVWNMPHYEGADQMSCRAAAYLIEHYQPDIMYIHLILIDHLRHVYGVFHPKLAEGYAFLDKALEKLFKVLEYSGLSEHTIINFTSDHGHLNVERVCSLNRFFKDQGLLQVDSNGELLHWDAYAHSCGLSAHIYAKTEVKSLLARHQRELGIGEILTTTSAKSRYHVSGAFSCIVETDGCTAFSSDYNAPLMSTPNEQDYRYSRATHGHQPQKGVQPTFFLYNPYQSTTVDIDRGRIVDQAPTLSELMGFSMPYCDGQPIQALLTERGQAH